MACYHPLSLPHLEMRVACGQCWGCRLERSRQWAVRCMHEASLYEDNCFITLTYSDEFLPDYGSLDKRAFQLFMKRLRKEFSGETIRFFHCGEYGALEGRPHYHACLFNFDFKDKVLWTTRKGFPAYRSVTLERLWPFGQSEIGSVTFDSAAYVARYILKKRGNLVVDYDEQYNYETGEVYRRGEEYVTMSRRPGIGKPWLDKFHCEVYPADSVVVRGHLQKPPRYYDKQYELVDPLGFEGVSYARYCRRNVAENTPERLEVREKCAIAQNDFAKERSLDSHA